MSDPMEDRRIADIVKFMNMHRQSLDTESDTDEFYCCPCCGYEAHADKFGRYCPMCKADLDEYEGIGNE